VQAALVAENKVLSHPASVDSVPTSGGQEDHVSMGWGGARKLLTIVENVRRVLAIEIICAVTGLEHRSPLQPAPGTSVIASRVRSLVPPLEGDRSPSADIEAVVGLISSGDLAVVA
jgi:histidine ammonia-lyase